MRPNITSKSSRLIISNESLHVPGFEIVGSSGNDNRMFFPLSMRTCQVSGFTT